MVVYKLESCLLHHPWESWPIRHTGQRNHHVFVSQNLVVRKATNAVDAIIILPVEHTIVDT